jgi:hypothetical protein
MRAKEFITEIGINAAAKRRARLRQQQYQNAQQSGLWFKGSRCTKDCSGHKAGYEWYKINQRVPNSHSQSFNNGARIARQGK